MSTYPILFTAPLVRAILEGQKVQTRRFKAPWHRLDELWVRETLRLDASEAWRYAADGAPVAFPIGNEDKAYQAAEWVMAQGKQGRRVVPSIHMPYWSHRLRLCVRSVATAPVQAITDADAREEGFVDRLAFRTAWEALYGVDAWANNPDVVVTRFDAYKGTPQALAAASCCAAGGLWGALRSLAFPYAAVSTNPQPPSNPMNVTEPYSVDVSTLRVILFDADGTLRRCTVPGRNYPIDGSEWELFADVRPRLRACLQANRRLAFGIVSNQGGVHSRKLAEDTARQLLEDTARAAFVNLGASAAGAPCFPPWAVRYCPHSLQGNCLCRKPSPALLFETAAVFESPGATPIQRSECLYVGDLLTDMQAATNAGFHFAWACDFFGRATPCEGKLQCHQVPG